jgi:hypothetical protein
VWICFWLYERQIDLFTADEGAFPEDPLDEPFTHFRWVRIDRSSADPTPGEATSAVEAAVGTEKCSTRAVSADAPAHVEAVRKHLLQTGRKEVMRDAGGEGQESDNVLLGALNSLLSKRVHPEPNKVMKTARKTMDRRRGALRKVAK